MPNPRLQRTPSASPSSPLSRKPLGDLAHRGAECGERSPGPGHGNSHCVAKYAARWQWLSFHRGVARLASSWRIGWRSSSSTAPAKARQSSDRAHSSPNPRLQRTRVGPLGRRSPLSRQPLGDLAHRGAECGERSPSPGHRDSQSVAKHTASWQWLSFHRGVARLASSWRIGWRSSSRAAPEAARRSSSGAHSSPNPRLQRTRSASPPSPLSRQPLGARSISAAAVSWVVLILLLGCLSAQAQPRESSDDPIDKCLRLIKASHFRPLDIDDVRSLFSENRATELTQGGAPVILQWAEPSGPCKIQFAAGSLVWGDQVQVITVRCEASDKQEAQRQILKRAAILSTEAIQHTKEYLERGFSGLSLDWAGKAWARSGAHVGVGLYPNRVGWQSELTINYPLPSDRGKS